ncbi:MAG: hemerythrin domain-containing protein [Candidatus Pacearchaeota archaeon]
MKNPLDILKKEHEQIEMELFQLESVMEDDEVINYPNLVHCFKELCSIWDIHEEKEEKVFGIMEKERIKMPVYKMTCEHRDLRGHINRIKEAINSGNEAKLRERFESDLKRLISKIRAHKNMEDEVLYTIALEEFTPEELEDIGKILGSE